MTIRDEYQTQYFDKHLLFCKTIANGFNRWKHNKRSHG